MAAIHTNTLFVAFLGITFVCWAPLIVYIQIVQPVRALFAWAFDQVIPEQIAQINERTHTPGVAAGLIAVASTPVPVCGRVHDQLLQVHRALDDRRLPDVRAGRDRRRSCSRTSKKAAYEASVSNISFLGVPLMVLFGIGSIVAGLFGAWLWFEYPQLGLPGAGKSLADQLFTTPVAAAWP